MTKKPRDDLKVNPLKHFIANKTCREIEGLLYLVKSFYIGHIYTAAESELPRLGRKTHISRAPELRSRGRVGLRARAAAQATPSALLF